MLEMKDLGFPQKSVANLKEQLVRTTLRNVRSQGHPYIDLRVDGKKLIFFCTLCLAPCYGDSSLFDHLKGNLHTKRLAFAQVTLMKSNPWPFSDGLFFFHIDSKEQHKSVHVSEEKLKNGNVSESYQHKLLDANHVDTECLAIVSYKENLELTDCTQVPQQIRCNSDSGDIPYDSVLEGNGIIPDLVIPAVLQKDAISNLMVKHMGLGRIGARFCKKDGDTNYVHRIWCEWLGNTELGHEEIKQVPEHEFAVITFTYNYSLGRKGLLDGLRNLLPHSPDLEVEDSGSPRARKRKSFSDPEDISSNQGYSSGEESMSSKNSNLKMIVSETDDQLVFPRILFSKMMRKQLRHQQRVASERSCDICQQRMLPDKDVAALLNRRTGKLACSSRNVTGAFHLFHVSCLIHWILLCEVEIYVKQPAEREVKQKSRRKIKGKGGRIGKKPEMQENQVHSVFCPECQGTGIKIDGDEVEKPIVPLSEVFRYKIKLCDARKAWMRSPEVSQNCTMGFSFPLNSSEFCQENVASLKYLRFYHVLD